VQWRLFEAGAPLTVKGLLVRDPAPAVAKLAPKAKLHRSGSGTPGPRDAQLVSCTGKHTSAVQYSTVQNSKRTVQYCVVIAQNSTVGAVQDMHRRVRTCV